MQSSVHAMTILLAAIVAIIAAAKFLRRRNIPSSEAKVGANRPKNPAVIVPLEAFDWKAEEPPKFRPFKPIYHIGMGLRPDTPSDLITIDKNYLARVTLRRQLLHRHGKMLHGCAAAGQDAVRELYGFLMSCYLPVRFPTIFHLSQDKLRIHNLVTGEMHPTTASDDAAASLRTIGRTVEEDMFLVRETSDGHRSVAFVCCFPAGFNPSTKLDKLLKDIHGPVPSYERIGPSMERFFSRLKVGKSVKRLNWVVQTHDELLVSDAHHAPHPGVKENGSVDIENTYLRVELQTLTRLPLTRDILFSFKTCLYPLREIKDEGLGPDLAEAVQGLRMGNAPGMWAYKAGAQWAAGVSQYLRGVEEGEASHVTRLWSNT
ncbi:hypothetical protein L249_5122 [Ophiocordyceps polyrhachis-furcata BCC 54312]|uniref:Uncharacterized protein n=1 Tax=Ophiocordyceps polyrhachis-furcata BCC 54312 TaxID=1330021 RepID=A0A367L3T4_9HYPO|nr:hypothetical protein L249_5122 [Ophiocordyceps polyrhachis-furcata BCC 54312]